MTFGTVSAPSHLVRRRHAAIFLPLAVGLVVGVVLWRAGEQRRTARSPGPGPADNVCVYPPEPVAQARVTLPDPPAPAAAWGGLERCLREDPFASASRPPVTVADVRRWVEVEHDPVWFHENQWWFPLSGEGDPQMPSGLYVAVPLEASAPCGGAIIN
ncbi:MAG TPA: hypothetical protein VM261_03745 [Kofleriaceae bacterium]|nr:hypothetical protein [Kofleriaceae bacterium]